MKRPNIRNYDQKKDADAVHRIWREIAWLTEDHQEKQMDIFISGGRALVAELKGEVECLTTAVPGELRYLDEDLPLSVVASVTTSRVARKQGLAQYTTAQLIAEEAAAGAAVSTLGIFEQGFYNLLGYGSGGYQHWISFDPADLKVDRDFRVPKRLGKDEFQLIHQAMLDRRRPHGAVRITAPEFYQGEAGFDQKAFGLGYCDGPNGELTHFFWGNPGDGESGPYRIIVMGWQSWNQFFELMALIKSLGDQVRLVKMCEPAGIHMQDLVSHPFRGYTKTEKSKYESTNRAWAYWQMRICDLSTCLSRTHLDCTPFSFNLELNDPIEELVPEASAWKGVSGRYTVTLGPESSTTESKDDSLPTLKAGVGAFTRMWLGVLPATSLAVTDDLSGPESLLNSLDQAFLLPNPNPGMDY